MEPQLQLLNVGLDCECGALFPILVRELPLEGYYFCYGCNIRVKVGFKNLEESSEQEDA